MTEPLVSFRRFCIACLLGALLGLYYGFLRPLGHRHRHLRDLLFVPPLFWAWLYLSFAVCKGDLRLWYTGGLLGGCLLWDRTVGKPLRPLFYRFWRFPEKLFRFFLFPLKKIFKLIRKILKYLL